MTPEERDHQHRQAQHKVARRAASQGLGELPRDLDLGIFQRVRRVFKWPFNRKVPLDVAANIQLGHAAAAAAYKEPTFDYTVLSVYQSRPVQGEDWVKNGQIEIGDTPAIYKASVNYQVPTNYRGIITGFKYQMTPAIVLSPGDVVINVYVEEQALIGFKNIYLGSSLSDYQQCWGIAEQQKIIRVEFQSTLPDDFLIDIQMQGNLIMDTGTAKEFQAANPPRRLT